MNKKQVTVDELLRFLGEAVVSVDGEWNGVFIDNLADAAHVTETTLDWVNASNPQKQSVAERSKAKVMIVDTSIPPISGKVLIHVKNPKRSLAQIGNHFFVEKPTAGIHPTAVIDPEAVIGEGVHIGPYTIVGKATIGNGCCLDSNVRVYDNVIMGCNCNVKAGAVLGGAGFGFEKDGDGNKFRFPQIGRLILGDDVEVGANTCIDRGALSDTVVGDHTKINNLCHIAHNNRIGNNVTITGCVNVSGSNVIDDNVWIAPNASIRGFVHLGESCTVGMGAVVTKDVPAGEVWVGNPARKMDKK